MGDRDGRLFLSSGAFSRQTFERSQGACEGQVPCPAVGVPQGWPHPECLEGTDSHVCPLGPSLGARTGVQNQTAGRTCPPLQRPRPGSPCV